MNTFVGCFYLYFIPASKHNWHTISLYCSSLTCGLLASASLHWRRKSL